MPPNSHFRRNTSRGSGQGEVARFAAMHAGAQGAYRRFVLSTRGLSPTLRPLHAALERVRGALPFYANVAPVVSASYNDFEAVAAKVDLDAVTARFVYDHVVLEPDAPDAERHGPVLFNEAAQRHFPTASDARASELASARRSLNELLVSRKAQLITRAEIVDALGAGFANLPSHDHQAPLRIHTASGPEDKTPDGAIPFHWTSFFGGTTRVYPPEAEWNDRVLGQLRAFRQSVVETGRQRSIALTGSRRLSTSVAIGSVLSAVAGFRIEMNYKGEIWRTDAHPEGSTPDYVWREHFFPGANSSGELAVGIGVINDVEPEACRWLDAVGLGDTPRLFLHSTIPITSASHGNRAAGLAKAAIQSALGKLGAKRIRLFLAVPSYFAIFVGHRLNASAPIICHEPTDCGYVPTCSVWGLS